MIYRFAKLARVTHQKMGKILQFLSTPDFKALQMPKEQNCPVWRSLFLEIINNTSIKKFA
ncbi:MAG: hypothetical protein AAFQ80_00805 [Cyanobacteria bacterium J06621_8]